MKTKIIFLAVIIFFSPLQRRGVGGETLAQITFQKTFGGTNGDEGKSVQQTTDGGYIIAGVTGSFGAGGADVYLIKTDANGDTLWTKTYGGISDEWANSIQQTTDGGYIIAGQTASFGAGDWDVYLIKTDGNRDTLWTKTFGTAQGDRGFAVIQTTDGGYVISGERSYSFLYLIKTNSIGSVVWEKVFPNGTDGNSVEQTTDGGYFIAGMSIGGGFKTYLLKTNSNGDSLWTKKYDFPGVDWAATGHQTSDGGYILVGETMSFGSGYYDVYLVKTDSNGDTLWAKTFGGTTWDGANSVQQTTDEGYIITGFITSIGAGNRDVYLIKTDAIGNVLMGIDDVQKNRYADVQIYPNPFTHSTAIRITNNEQGIKNYELIIFDLLGRTVYQQTLNSKQETLNLKISSGIYFYKIQTDKQTIAAGKLIIQ